MYMGCRIKTVGFTSAPWVIYARCNGSRCVLIDAGFTISDSEFPGAQKSAR